MMERDLSVIRKRRAQRMGVKSASKPSSPPLQDLVDLGNLEESALLAEPTSNADEAGNLQANDDTIMLDLRSGDINQQVIEDAVMTNVSEMPVADPNHLDSFIPDKSITSDIKSTRETENDDKKVANKGSEDVNEQQASGDAFDFDIDSMFNDPDMVGVDASTNFDIGLSVPNGVDHNALGVSSFENLDVQPGYSSNAARTSEDINTLLPDLDALFNASDVPTEAIAGTDPAVTASDNTANAANSPDAAVSRQRNLQQPDQGAIDIDDLFGDNFGASGDMTFDFGDDDWLK